MPEQTSMLFGTPERTEKRICTFDLETIRGADEVGGWDHVHKMGMAVGVIHDSIDDEYHVYEEKDVPALVQHLQRADLIVGFNHIRFDYKVLTGYSDVKFLTLPNFDILVDVNNRLGHRLKLDSLVTATLNAKKSADGLQSLKWVKEGKLDLVKTYCKQDVQVTKDLFHYGVEKGKVYYTDRNYEKVVLHVDWSIKELISKAK